MGKAICGSCGSPLKPRKAPFATEAGLCPLCWVELRRLSMYKDIRAKEDTVSRTVRHG